MSRPGDWARDGDYPPAALRNHVDGITGFVLAIPTTGVPEKCTISRSSGSNELDTQTCNLMMQRARFKPAIDAEGNPISGTYSSVVRWKAPIIVPPAPAFVVPAQMPMTLEFSYYEETDGSITHCSIERVIGAMDAETASSRLCQYPKHRTPYLNKDGKPVRRHIVSNQIITVTDAP